MARQLDEMEMMLVEIRATGARITMQVVKVLDTADRLNRSIMQFDEIRRRRGMLGEDDTDPNTPIVVT